MSARARMAPQIAARTLVHRRLFHGRILSGLAGASPETAGAVLPSGSRVLETAVEAALARGLHAFGRKIADRASRGRYGFTDRSGRLRGSIRTRRPMVSGGKVFVAISATRDYAFFIERTQRGRYSFLERAARELEPQLEDVAGMPVEVTIRRFNDG